ncbi:HlyD family type I secretion periplasmic adaptor subunit [Vibrio sp. Isolate22]|nr:HlyD family type I secretion periplasmic adaptor subunit [Vibrio sp. Isolate22]MCG9693809.1 HlyD family type I secretion periplasmic adaptor subunit [Vibrio sp. Isolate22]
MFRYFKTIVQAWRKENQTEKVVIKSRDEYEFQPGYLEIIDRPPAPFARRTALALMALIIVTILWSVFGRLDINANATGRLIVTSRSKVIQPISPGEIAAINVQDGQRVEQGDVLITLNVVGVDSEIEEFEQQLIYKQLEQARLLALLETQAINEEQSDPLVLFVAPAQASASQVLVAKDNLRSDWQEIMTNLERLDSDIVVNEATQQAREIEVNSLRKLIANIKTRLEASRLLVEKEQFPRIEYLAQQKELLSTQFQLAEKQNEATVLKAQANSLMQQRSSYLSQTRKAAYDTLSNVQAELAVITQKLVQAQDKRRQHKLLAPVSGVVQQLAVHTVGGVVQPAQALMVIVPEGALLEAEVMVLNKDVGFVYNGQHVEVKVDAFPYTRYGTLAGKVVNVSKDAVENEQLGLVFPTRVNLTENNILVEDQYVPLQAGMSINAEIRTGDRRVIDYLLSPLQQYQSEALRER